MPNLVQPDRLMLAKESTACCRNSNCINNDMPSYMFGVMCEAAWLHNVLTLFSSCGAPCGGVSAGQPAAVPALHDNDERLCSIHGCTPVQCAGPQGLAARPAPPADRAPSLQPKSFLIHFIKNSSRFNIQPLAECCKVAFQCTEIVYHPLYC